MRNTLQFYCVFDTPLGTRDHVRVDVAPKKILTANPLLLGSAASDFTQASVAGFSVYSIEDLTARKMYALLDRCEGKDVYDVANALPLCGRLDAAVSKTLESEGKNLSVDEFVSKAIKRLNDADARKLRNLTNPLIPFARRPKDWKEFKDDLAFKLENAFKRGE